MTTEENPTVEEALGQVVVYGVALPPLVKVEFTNDLGHLIEAVRREERERAYIQGWNEGVRAAGRSVLLELRPPPERARSSEEAGG